MRLLRYCILLPTVATLAYSQTSGFFISGLAGLTISHAQKTLNYDGIAYDCPFINCSNTGQGFLDGPVRDENTTYNNFLLSPDFGARVGYLIAFHEGLMGIRLYGTFNYGRYNVGTYADDVNSGALSSERVYSYMGFGGAIDYMLFFNSTGVFGGIGYEVLKLQQDKLPLHAPYLNVGVVFSFAKGHLMFEIGTKIHIIAFDYNHSNLPNQRVITEETNRYVDTTRLERTDTVRNYTLYTALTLKL